MVRESVCLAVLVPGFGPEMPLEIQKIDPSLGLEICRVTPKLPAVNTQLMHEEMRPC
jgi:hypothetical protein